MDDLTTLQTELLAHQDDLAACKEMLELDPESADAREMIPVLEAEIADLQSKIAAAQSNLHTSVPPPPPPPPENNGTPSSAKFDMTKHPKFNSSTDTPPPPPPDDASPVQYPVFNVGDVVMAKWSEDKQWYHATVVSRTGSNTDPVYKVNFKGYTDKETKRRYEVRALDNPRKRKAESTSVANTAPSSPQPARDGPVIAAAAAVDKTLMQKREPSRVSDGPMRIPPEPKKLKGNKALDKAKSSWQTWQQSGPKKGAAAGPKKVAKDSQFRTPDLPGAKGESLHM